MLSERVAAAYETALEKNANVAGGAAAAGEGLLTSARKAISGVGASISREGSAMKSGLRKLPMGKATLGQQAQHTVGRGLQAYGQALAKNPLATAGATAAGVGATGYMATR